MGKTAEKTEKNKGGRPAVAGEPRSKTAQIRLTPREFDEFQRMGGASWLRALLNGKKR